MTRLVNNRRVRVLALLAAAALGASAAWGFWIAPASGTAAGHVGSLAAPTAVEASAAAGKTTVSVSWTASAPSGGVAPTGYYVERWNAGTATLAGGACGSPGSPTTATSCEVTGVPDGTYTYTVVARYRSWTAASSPSAPVTVLHDSTPPSTSLATEPASPDGSGEWFRDATVTFTLTATDAGTGVAGTFYAIDGGPAHSYSTPVAVTESEHNVEYWSTDNAGNVEARHTAHVKLDATAPTDAVSLGESPVHAYLSGSTLYFASSLGGSFSLRDTVSDAGSGASSATFPLLSAAHWTHAAQVVTSPAGGLFTSGTYSWTAGAATPGATERTVTSSDAAGNLSAGSALSFAPDSQAPTGGALIVNGTAAAAAAGASTSSSTSTSFSIGSRTDYQEAQSASQSGLRSSTLTIQSAPLAKNVCGAPGSGGAYTSATVIGGAVNPAIAGGYCYLYTLTGIDNVGNTASVSTTVKVDTTPPTSPSVQLSGATGSTFLSGTTAYINPQAGRSGSFIATAAATDAESGIATILLPALSGFTGGGGTLTSPFETTYAWSGALAAAGAQSVTATDGAGLTETNPAAFTVVQDTTAPSGGTVSVPARVHAASVPVTFTVGTDAGSGISSAQGQLLRAEAAYAVGSDSCGSFGTFSTFATGVSSPASDTGVANGKCYEYEYRASDNVGNTALYGPTTPVKVDTTAPKASSLTAQNGTGTAHKPDAKDVIAFTFSENIEPASITSAWSAASQPEQTVTVTFKDSGEGNGTNKPDSFSVTTAGVHLGSVETSSGNWVPTKSGSYSFTATMRFGTSEGKTVVTLTLTSLNSGGATIGTENGEDKFTWTPDPALTDLAGNAIDTSVHPESKATHF